MVLSHECESVQWGYPERDPLFAFAFGPQVKMLSDIGWKCGRSPGGGRIRKWTGHHHQMLVPGDIPRICTASSPLVDLAEKQQR
ncbi:hypothetical protein PAL_GLEAN10010976 [Pteropus alecto]|uniref:Uncharacterized protein n=1 Tax=Pteropus alecto TaxID=9402 RepID=L5KWJ7_PTEAL|nr:hypothetical protein PAL_GLEAN10010976 [Pteropus alecto]